MEKEIVRFVKLLLRLFAVLLLLLALLPAAVWYTFPWYVQPLLDRALAGKPFRVEISGLGRPTFSGIGFRSLKAVFTTPPDECNEEPTTYTLSLDNGSISYNFRHPNSRQTGTLPLNIAHLTITLQADSLSVIPDPQQFTYGDRKPVIRMDAELFRDKGLSLSLKPVAATYTIENAVVTREKLRLEGIRYNVKLGAATKWQQPLDTLRIAKFSSDEKPMPARNFTALFGSKRDPLNPCTLTLSRCSLELLQWRASTERIDYNLKKKQTKFTFDLPEIPLNALPGLNKTDRIMPLAAGRISGSIPIEFQDSTILIRNAMVVAKKGSSLTFYTKEKKPYLALDLGSRQGGGELLKKLNASITFSTKEKKPAGLAMKDLSATLFGGTISATPFSMSAKKSDAAITITLNDIKLLDRLRLLGDLKGSLNGGISGTVPLSLTKNSFAIVDGKLQSKGGGNVTITPPPPAKRQTTAERLFGQEKGEATYTFSQPELLFSRAANGSTTVSFALKQLQQKNASGAMDFIAPKGTIQFGHERTNPNIITLSDFSVGVLDGKIALQRIDYDMLKKEGTSTVQLTHMPLQKLIDFQGAKKIYATGWLKGTLPIKLKNETFEIINGTLNAEDRGQIIYTTTTEERAASNPGLRMTYDILSNFLYTDMLSSVNMAPDGKSSMAIQLKGANPDFQAGRSVELNFAIQQNLRDLMRSLSISSDVEQIISDKATEKKP
jgi:hypothetical protein